VHEYSIVAALIDQVAREVRVRCAARVHRLHLDIGELAGVEIELLELAYDTFKSGSVCDGAVLETHRVAAVWACPSCARPIARGAILRCGRCGAPARLTQGDEIVLARIEMEVSDV
jgi:hydrogenase nickel incorporation protein HypA/HybF